MNRLIKTPIRNFSFHNILKCLERFKISNGVKILIISIAVFGAGFFSAPFANAVQVDELVVDFEKTPLFSEGDFKPGDSVVRWIEVTNNSEQTQRIATEAINYPDPTPAEDLSRALMFVIKEGATDLYGGSSPTGPKSLYNFYQDSKNYSEISLSDLASGATTQYDFKISFPAEKGNEWQNATTTFDILIGFQSGASPLPPSPPAPPSGGGGGDNGPPGGLPPGLTILNEAAVDTQEVSVTITWQTSYPASSQVIYALESEKHTLDLSDSPKYGYERTTPEYDSFLKVINHSVTIDGLTPGTVYYYRAVSHASLAISYEHSFTTLTTEGAIARLDSARQAKAAGIAATEEETTAGEVTSGIAGAGAVEQPQAPEENIQDRGVKNLAATILGFSGSWIFWIILFLILVIILFLVIKKKKKNN